MVETAPTDMTLLQETWEQRLAEEGLGVVNPVRHYPLRDWGEEGGVSLGSVLIREEPARLLEKKRSILSPLLQRIPAAFRVALELHLQGMTQHEAGRVLGIQQPAFHGRLVKGISHLKVVTRHPEPTELELCQYEPNERVRWWIKLYLQCWNGVQVADEVGISQSSFWGGVSRAARDRKDHPLARFLLDIPHVSMRSPLNPYDLQRARSIQKRHVIATRGGRLRKVCATFK